MSKPAGAEKRSQVLAGKVSVETRAAVQSALTSINVARVVSGEKPWTVSDLVEASVRLLLSHLAHPESIHTLVDEYKRSELPSLQQTNH